MTDQRTPLQCGPGPALDADAMAPRHPPAAGGTPTRRSCLALSAWLVGALAGCGGGASDDPAAPATGPAPAPLPPAPSAPSPPPPAPVTPPPTAPAPPPPAPPPPVAAREPRFGQTTMLSPTLWRIWSMAQDGSDPRTVREFDRRVWGARWSPDGRRIAFYDQSEVDVFFHRLYVMDADGANLRAAGWGDSTGGLSWHPDSRHLLYTRYGVVRPDPASTVIMRDGFFHVVDTDTGLAAFSASVGVSGVYTAGCACTASFVYAPFWRGPTNVVYNASEQRLADPANPVSVGGSKVRVKSLSLPALPAFDVPLSGIGRVGEGDNLNETIVDVHPALGLLYKENLPSGAVRLVRVAPSGSRSVVLADGGGRPFSWSPDGTMCRWNEDFHRWADFDPVGMGSRIGPAPVDGQYWYLAS